MRKQLITITRNAFLKMNTIMEKSNNKNGFLFSVHSGGCNGFNFNLELLHDKYLQKTLKQKPSIVKYESVKVYIEPLSELYLIGTEIDFLEENYQKGIFESKFIYNVDKRLATTCGCGISFTPKSLDT